MNEKFNITVHYMVLKKSLKIPKWVIRICKSKKNRQHNGQKKKCKRTNNDLQNTTEKTKDRATPANPTKHSV